MDVHKKSIAMAVLRGVVYTLMRGDRLLNNVPMPKRYVSVGCQLPCIVTPIGGAAISTA
ncbi:MAG: hypothetical protein ACREOJ_18215 [Gemmatimonadaceae bacterium]